MQKADWCDPELNPKLMSFCRRYGCALVPCLPRTPEHKGKIERGIGYLKGNALAGRTFKGLSAESEFLRHWEKTVADVRIHGTTRQQVAALFAQEQKTLLPLPPGLFSCFQEGQRTVHRDSYVEVDKAYYTVPPEYISQVVWVCWDRHEVRVFNQRWEQIKLHAHLSPGQFDTPVCDRPRSGLHRAVWFVVGGWQRPQGYDPTKGFSSPARLGALNQSA